MFVLKSFHFDSLQHNGHFWPPFGKKVLFGIGTGSLKQTQNSLQKNPWPFGVAVAENWKVCQPIKNLSGHLCIRNNMKSTQLTSSIFFLQISLKSKQQFDRSHGTNQKQV